MTSAQAYTQQCRGCSPANDGFLFGDLRGDNARSDLARQMSAIRDTVSQKAHASDWSWEKKADDLLERVGSQKENNGRDVYVIVDAAGRRVPGSDAPANADSQGGYTGFPPYGSYVAPVASQATNYAPASCTAAAASSAGCTSASCVWAWILFFVILAALIALLVYYFANKKDHHQGACHQHKQKHKNPCAQAWKDYPCGGATSITRNTLSMFRD